MEETKKESIIGKIVRIVFFAILGIIEMVTLIYINHESNSPFKLTLSIISLVVLVLCLLGLGLVEFRIKKGDEPITVNDVRAVAFVFIAVLIIDKTSLAIKAYEDAIIETQYYKMSQTDSEIHVKLAFYGELYSFIPFIPIDKIVTRSSVDNNKIVKENKALQNAQKEFEQFNSTSNNQTYTSTHDTFEEVITYMNKNCKTKADKVKYLTSTGLNIGAETYWEVVYYYNLQDEIPYSDI